MLSGISILCFAACYAIAFALELIGLKIRVTWQRMALAVATFAGLLAHTIYLARITGDASAMPVSSAEWILLAGWVLAVVYFAALFYLPRSPTGLALLPIVLGLIISSKWASSEPLAPERSFHAWGVLHGVVLLLGTVAVCVGFLAGLMYLVQSYALKHARSPVNGLRLPSLEWLERVNSRSLGLSAILIALGFASGLVMSMAIHRGERAYQPWRDPVVLSLAAMMLWLVAAEIFRLVYPAARRGRKVAYLTLASFVFLVIALASLMLLDTVHGAKPAKNTNWESVFPTPKAFHSKAQGCAAHPGYGSVSDHPYPEGVSHWTFLRCLVGIANLCNAYGVNGHVGDYPGCAASRRPWALELNTFGVRTRTPYVT